MALLYILLDDPLAEAQSDRRLGRSCKTTTQPINIRDLGEGSNKKMHKSLTMQAVVSPGTPTNPTTPRKDDVWSSVFNPGTNLPARSIGSNIFDKPNSPSSLYDCLYSGESKNQHR